MSVVVNSERAAQSSSTMRIDAARACGARTMWDSSPTDLLRKGSAPEVSGLNDFAEKCGSFGPGSLQRMGRFHEVGRNLVERCEQRVAVEPEHDEHEAVDASVAVAGDVVLGDRLQVR